MGNVYLWKADGRVIAHTNLEAAAQLDGLTGTPHRIVTDQEWAAAQGLARVIGGEIFLGKTDEEKAVEAAQQRVAEIDTELAAINSRAGAGRAPRSLLLQQAENEQLGGLDVEKLQEAETEAQALRTERAEQLAIAGGV
jgi:hypothetical protein